MKNVAVCLFLLSTSSCAAIARSHAQTLAQKAYMQDVAASREMPAYHYQPLFAVPAPAAPAPVVMRPSTEVGAGVACTSDFNCPGGWHCQPNLHLCASRY